MNWQPPDIIGWQQLVSIAVLSYWTEQLFEDVKKPWARWIEAIIRLALTVAMVFSLYGSALRKNSLSTPSTPPLKPAVQTDELVVLQEGYWKDEDGHDSPIRFRLIVPKSAIRP